MLRVVAVALGSALALFACVPPPPPAAPTDVQVGAVASAPRRADARRADSSRGAPVATARKAGDRVEVEWHASWYPATLLERRGERWLVHYDGYGDEWDEVVADDRVREREAPAEPMGEEADEAVVDP